MATTSGDRAAQSMPNCVPSLNMSRGESDRRGGLDAEQESLSHAEDGDDNDFTTGSHKQNDERGRTVGENDHRRQERGHGNNDGEETKDESGRLCALAHPRSSRCGVGARPNGWYLRVRLGKSVAGMVELGSGGSIPARVGAYIVGVVDHPYLATWLPLRLTMSSYTSITPAILAVRHASTGRPYDRWGFGLTCARSAAGPLAPPYMHPTSFPRRIDHVSGPVVRGSDDVAPGNWNGVRADPTKHGLRNLNVARAVPTKQELGNWDGTKVDLTEHELGNWNGVGADPTKQGLRNLNVARADPTKQELENWDGTRVDLTEHELGNWNGVGADPTKQGLGNLNVTRADPTEQELGNWDGTGADLTEHELGNWNSVGVDPT
ncbi:hypothetical protein B296_00042460 [Ensete ventricosum]|uniref:Uncharacterized protein n=1 Tax=Ensete ventricosum TaxID=4639 RepID=A0A426XNI1_ENSVE|nr:hypothetical protein B296_00042460 [Ensete ventricosum]